MERRQRRIFPDAFKREAVDRVASSGLSPGRVGLSAGAFLGATAYNTSA
jgi:transposase-like protein